MESENSHRAADTDSTVLSDLSDDSEIAVWDNLVERQSSMYKETLRQNVALRREVAELRGELDAWRLGLNSKGKQREDLEATVTKLERNLAAIHEENPLVVCLIDGDGAVFSEDFLTRGKEGGREAAASLRTAIKNHLDKYNAEISESDGRNVKDSSRFGALGVAPRRINSPQIVCTIYFNRMGLCNTLLANKACTAQNFLDFFIGFNQASPLFTLIDVGDGKEAADAKLRESLKLYSRLPQTRKIFFGAAHDNGYMPSLMSLATEGHLDKLVILKGYDQMAHELDMFLSETGVDVISVPGLFLRNKLTSGPQHYKKPSFSGQQGRRARGSFSDVGSADASTHSGRGSPSKPPTPFASPRKAQKQSQRPNNGATSAALVPPVDDLFYTSRPSPRRLDPNKSLANQSPPPCNSFYLTPLKCKFDSSVCKFSHDYELSPERLLELKEELATIACPILTRSGRCKAGPKSCLYSHQCPGGLRCTKLPLDACNFLHDEQASSSRASPGLTTSKGASFSFSSYFFP